MTWTLPTRQSGMRGLVKILEDYMEINRSATASSTELELLAVLDETVLSQFFHWERVEPYTVIYDRQWAPAKLYLVDKGVVEILVVDGGDDPTSLPGGAAVVRINKVSSGGIFGTDAFLLNLPHRCRALTLSETSLWSITRPDLALLEVQHPKLCLIIQQVMLKSMALLSNATLYNHPGGLDSEYHPIYK